MDSKRKVSLVFSNNNPQGSRQTGRPKNRWWDCVQTDINSCKIKNWKERSKTELIGRRQRSILECSAIEEEKEEEEEDDDEGEEE